VVLQAKLESFPLFGLVVLLKAILVRPPYPLSPHPNRLRENMGFKFNFKSLRDFDSEEGTVKLVDGMPRFWVISDCRRTSIKRCGKHRYRSYSTTLGQCERPSQLAQMEKSHRISLRLLLRIPGQLDYGRRYVGNPRNYKGIFCRFERGYQRSD
jgi:hypothetical protein